jgi:hypothetical protein
MWKCGNGPHKEGLVIQNFGGGTSWKEPLGRPGVRWNDNVKIKTFKK